MFPLDGFWCLSFVVLAGFLVVFQYIWSFVFWLFVLDRRQQPTNRSEGRENAVEVTTQLIGGILGLTTALILVDQERPPGVLLRDIAIYVILCVLFTFGMACLLHNNRNDTPVYDGGSLMYIRFSFLTSIILVPSMAFWAWTGQLPGRAFTERVPLHASMSGVHDSKDKEEGSAVYLDTGFRKELFPDGVPAQMNLVIRLDDKFAADWIPTTVVAWEYDSSTRKRIANPALRASQFKSSPITIFELEDLKNADHDFRIYLRKRTKAATSEEAELLKAEATSSRLVDVSLYKRKKEKSQ